MHPVERKIKRILDLAVSAAALVFLFPVMLVIAVLIRADSPGPSLFRQQRVGLGGKTFKLFKFRTMRPDVDPYGFSPADGSDPRLTRIGKPLREHSLDELPQLINVLLGHMSLVGPRPLLLWQYEKWTPRQRRRCEVKPGLTGWAQVLGRTELTHEEKIELDLWYVDHAGLWLDLKILWMTIAVVLKRQGTYEPKYSQRQNCCRGPDNPGRRDYN